MRIHLIRRETIEEYMVDQARSRVSFEDWLEKIRRADWHTPDDIYETFNSADLLGNGCDRVVFDIAGNSFRMIA
ncbi:MAG TPA: type II toxin-antitoxin system HigB family toxin, partial [Puia sp.]|nr:type II toxin-antitoxin system HigB family toxin [Puia sp.]